MKKQLIIFAFMIMALSLTSCRSKKKVVDREVNKTERTEEKKNSETSHKTVLIDSITQNSNKTITTSDKESIEVIAANDSSVVDIKKQVTDNLIHWSITGSRSFRIVNDKNKTQSVDSSVVVVARNETSSNLKTEEQKLDESINTRKRTTDTNSSGVSFGFYIWIFFALIIVIIFAYFKKRFGSIKSAWNFFIGNS
jgi:cobalamin biosynthesis Mg chelatase CobN